MTKKIRMDKPIKRIELEERFKKLWDGFHDSESGSTTAFGIEAAAANPCGLPPLFAIKQANDYLIKHPSILTRYTCTRGLKFIRKELVDVVKSICSYSASIDNSEPIDEENISLAPGINSSINLISRYLRNKSKQEFPNKIPCIVTNEYFYTIPDILDVKYLSANSGLLIHDGVDSRDIHNALEKSRKLNMNPIIYYNVTPDNPTGTITSRERSMEQDDVFREPENRSVLVLNDLAYHMTYLEKNEVTYPILGFGIQSALMFGLSKIASPGSRISLIASGRNFLNELEISSFNDYMFPSIHSQLVLYFFFKKSNESLRLFYLEQKRKNLRFNSKLMLAMINGIDHVKNIESSEVDKIYQLLKNQGIRNYKEFIKNGLGGVSIINDPKAAFFHILDFSSFRGKVYNDKKIIDGIDLAEIFHSISKTLLFPLDLLSLGNASSLLEETTLLMRVTYSMSPIEIINFVLSVKIVQEHLK